MDDDVVLITRVLRIVVVGGIFLLNGRGLLVACFHSPPCLHNLIATAVLVANVLYSLGWLPLVAYDLLHTTAAAAGPWAPLGERVHCLVQNFLVNAMAMVFLGLLAVRVADLARRHVFHRPPLRTGHSVALTFAAWVGPQLAYDLVSLAGNAHVHCSPDFHLPGTPSGATGFLICEQELSGATLTIHTWQYTALVLPLASLIGCCALMLYVVTERRRTAAGEARQPAVDDRTAEGRSQNSPHRRLSLFVAGDAAVTTDWTDEETTTTTTTCALDCPPRMTHVDLVLCTNFLWHLLIRPAIIVHAVYGRPSDATPTFLDVGSHAILTIAGVVVPVSYCYYRCCWSCWSGRAKDKEEKAGGIPV